MENASKALIIAGAILLAILIISLGIMIYNQASGVLNNNAMSEVDISTFNQKFEQYFGTKVKGANVRALLTAIRSNNTTNEGDNSKIITFDSSGAITSTEATVENGSTYKVEAGSNGYQNGLIHVIKITKNS